MLSRVAVLFTLIGLAASATPLIERMKGRKPALDASEAIARVIEALDDVENFLDIGSPIKGTAVMSSELARFLDPTLLTLESILFEGYCKTPGVNAFARKCKGLDQPTVYAACTDHGSMLPTGSVNFESTTPNEMCHFFIQSKGNKIDLKCKILDRLGDLSNIKVYSAANSAVNKVLSAGAVSVQYNDGLFVEFKNDATGSQKLACTWESRPTDLAV